MLRALTLASALTLFAGAAFAQSYPLPQDYPPAGQTPATAPGGGYGSQSAYGQGSGGYTQGAGGYGGQGSGYGQGPAGGYGAQGPGPDGGGYGAQGGYGAPGYGQGGRGRDPQARALRQQMRAACTTDIATYCVDAGQGGHGALHQCMMANQTRFSPGCQSAMGALRSYNQQKRANGGAQGYVAPDGQPPGVAYPPNAPSPQ